jgi:hypothetical protein
VPEIVRSINHLLSDRRLWASIVAATHEVEDPSSLGLAFGVDVDEAWSWFMAETDVGSDDIDEPLSSSTADLDVHVGRLEVDLSGGVRVQFDVHFKGFSVRLVDGSLSADLGEFTGHYRLPLLRPEEAVRLAQVAVRPPWGATEWRPSLATALVIGGSWSTDPSPQLVAAVASAWADTGLVTVDGAETLADPWRLRSSREPTTWLPSAGGAWVADDPNCTRGDTLAIDAFHAGLDSELRVSPRSIDALLARGLGDGR